MLSRSPHPEFLACLALLLSALLAGAAEPFLDLDREPLPPGAVARLGPPPFGSVHAAAFAPAGQTLALVADTPAGPAVVLWDVSTDKELSRLWGDVGDAERAHLAFSGDGKLLAIASGQHIAFREVATGRRLGKLVQQSERIHRFALSPDGRSVATAGDSTLALWDLETRTKVWTFSEFHNPLEQTAFSPDGQTLFSWEAGQEVRWHEAATGKILREFTIESEALIFSPDGKTFADNLWTGHIRLRKLTNGKVLRELEKPGRGFCFAPSGKVLALGEGLEAAVSLWEVSSGRLLRRIDSPLGVMEPAAFSADGNVLATLNDSLLAQTKTLHLWDVNTGKELLLGSGHHGPVTALAFAPDSRTLATACKDQTVRLWETSTGKELRRYHGSWATPLAVSFSPDGATLAAGGVGNTVHLWETATGKELRRWVARSDHPRPEGLQINFLAFSHDGQTLRAGSSDGTLHRWHVTDSAELATQDWPEADKWLQAASRDGAMVAVLERTRDPRRSPPIYLLDEDNRQLSRIEGNADEPFHLVAVAADGKLLAACSGSRVGLWETATGQQVLTLKTCAEGRSLAFSPDGRTLVTGCEGGSNCTRSAVVWDLATGRGVGRLPTGTLGEASAVAFSPDGRSLAVADDRGSALVWDATRLPRLGRHWPARLTPEQCQGLWTDLVGQDAARAHEALWRLAAASADSLPLLEAHLKPVAADPQRLARLITELDSDDFDVRQQASRQLEDEGAMAEAALRRALEGQPSAEVRRRLVMLLDRLPHLACSPAGLQAVRGTAVLERIGTPEARHLLETLAAGAPDALLTQEAQAALRRLRQRSASAPE